MGPTEVVEVLPLGQPLLQIDIALVAQELIELLLIRAMGTLDFPVQLWGAGLDVDVLDTLVREVPMKQRLELMAAVGAHRVNTEGKRPDHVVCEGDGVLLCVSPVDAERADPSGIIDRRVLVATDSLPGWPLEREELHVDLHVMPRDLFGLAMGRHGAPAYAIGQTMQPVAPQNAVDGGVRDAHAPPEKTDLDVP